MLHISINQFVEEYLKPLAGYHHQLFSVFGFFIISSLFYLKELNSCLFLHGDHLKRCDRPSLTSKTSPGSSPGQLICVSVPLGVMSVEPEVEFTELIFSYCARLFSRQFVFVMNQTHSLLYVFPLSPRHP